MPFADECNSASAIIAQWFSARDIARQLLCVQCACTYTRATECVIRLRWLAETTGLWVPAVSKALPYSRTTTADGCSGSWPVGCHARPVGCLAEPVFRKGVLPRGHMSFLPVALLALAWPGLTWYPWRMCLNLHFSYAVCLCNRLATNKPPGGANYNPHIAP